MSGPEEQACFVWAKVPESGKRVISGKNVLARWTGWTEEAAASGCLRPPFIRKQVVYVRPCFFFLFYLSICFPYLFFPTQYIIFLHKTNLSHLIIYICMYVQFKFFFIQTIFAESKQKSNNGKWGYEQYGWNDWKANKAKCTHICIYIINWKSPHTLTGLDRVIQNTTGTPCSIIFS